MASNRVWPFLAALWFYLWSWLCFGGVGFVRSMHRLYRRQEPSSFDLKVARAVGYMCIFFGSAALIQGLIQLIGYPK